MASGTGTFDSSNYHAATSLTGVKCSAVVSQSVNATTRKATITVRAMMSFYRISGNWSVTSGTSITSDTSTAYYVRATIDGQNSDAYHLGIVGNTSFTAVGGGIYRQSDGYIRSATGYNSEVTLSRTFDFDSVGSAISKPWSATVYYRGTTMTVGGTVVTDSIASLSKYYGSVNSQAVRITKLYGSVSGKAAPITKLYGSVNGQAVAIFQN